MRRRALERLRGAAVPCALAVLAGACAGTGAAGPRLAFHPGGEGLPFSEAVRAGDVLYVSGQIGVAPGTRALVPGGLPAQARQALDNIGAILARHGLGFDDVFKCTVMLADLGRWAEFNEVYVRYFDPARLPARSAFGAAALAFGGEIEIECLAFAGGR